MGKIHPCCIVHYFFLDRRDICGSLQCPEQSIGILYRCEAILICKVLLQYHTGKPKNEDWPSFCPTVYIESVESAILHVTIVKVLHFRQFIIIWLIDVQSITVHISRRCSHIRACEVQCCAVHMITARSDVAVHNDTVLSSCHSVAVNSYSVCSYDYLISCFQLITMNFQWWIQQWGNHASCKGSWKIVFGLRLKIMALLETIDWRIWLF